MPELTPAERDALDVAHAAAAAFPDDDASRADFVRLHRSLTNITPTPEQIVVIEGIRGEAKQFGSALLTLAPRTPERTLAIRKLEEAVMWAVKSVLL